MRKLETARASSFLVRLPLLIVFLMFFGLQSAQAQPACHAQFQHYSMPNNPDSVHFSAAQSTTTTHYQWSFGDGTSGHTRDPWHNYAHVGTYIACLTVTDSTSAGTCSDTWCDTVIVAAAQSPTCNAQFTHYAMQGHADSVHFYPMQTQNSPTAHYLWSFGDGTYSHNRDPWHRYLHAGSYVACLTVTDSTSA
ncbi:MAG: PKD domain-containing protein, partial [Bacteroidota bacterium]